MAQVVVAALALFTNAVIAVQAIGTAIGFGIGVGAIAAGAAVVIGGVMVAKRVMSLFEVEMPTVDTDASRQRTVKSTTEPQKIIYGEALVSGPISFIGLAGADNSDLYQTIVLAGHELTDITDIHMDDVVITDAQINGGSNAGGNVTAGTFGPKDSTTICTINKYLGLTSQTADSLLTNAFTNYTSAHRGDGIAYLAMKWVLNDDSAETWNKFAPSNVKALVKGKPVYDPRLDTGAPNYNPLNQLFITYNATVGSYVGQGQNPALVLADYLISDLGMGISPSKIDWSSFITAANGCDVSVSVPGGTEKRFTCNGVIFATDSHQKNINKILSSMNGNLVYSNGKYIVHAGIFEAHSESLNEDDLIGAISIKTSLERSDRFNTIKGLFIDPAQNHKSSEFPKVQLADAVTRDNNEVLEKEVQYPMTNSSYMAQRLSHKLIQLSDQQKVITFPANLSALRITAGDRVQVTVEELNWTNKIFQCAGWTFSEDGGVNLTLREDSSTSYADPAVNEYSTVTAIGDITDAFRGVPSPSGLRAASGEKKVFLNWVNPGKPSDFGTIEIWASATNAVSSAVKIGETDGTQFVHDGNNAADQIAVGNTRVYWVRSKKNVGTVADDAVSYYEPNSTTGVGPITVLATLVDWDNVANPTIGIDINSDTISINTGSATTTTGQTVATSGLEAGTTVTQGGITMNQGGSIKGGQSAYNSGTGFFLGYDTNKYKFSIGNASNEALTFDGTNLAITGAITATSGTFTGTVNASAGAFTGDVSTDSKFVAGSGATSATMDGGDQNYRIYAGGTTPALSSFKVDSDGVVTATRLVVTRPDDLSAVIFDSARDGLVGIGLSSISQDTGIVVQAPAVALTSQTNTVSVVLTASQTLTLETILALPTAKKYAGNYSTAQYPASITATMEYSTNSGSTWSTFGTAVALTVTAATSPSDTSKFGVLTYAVDGTGRTGYRRDVHAIDNINNIHFTKAVAGFAAGSYLFRVQLSFVAGSSPDTDYEPNITGNRTLQFGTDGAGFTVDEYGVITDSPSGTATIGYVQANYVALNNGNTITVGSGETNTFEDESSNEILVVSDTEVVARNLFRATWNGAQPTGTKIIRVTNPTGTAERFSVTEAGNLTTTTLGVTGDATITGDLTVNGTTTTVNTDNLTVKDPNITLNYSTGDSSSTANNSGITIQDAVSATTDASILWKTASDTFEFSHAITAAGISGYASDLISEDNRIIAPDELSGSRLKFGFTSWGNNNTSPYADFLHMRSYADSTGGSDNLVMFKKSGIGMRLWQQTYGSSTAYSTYEDVWHTGTLTTTDKTNYDTAYTYSQVGHLPLAGGTLTGTLTVDSTNDNQILLTSPNSWTGIGFNDSAAMATDYIWHNGTNGTFAIGGNGSNVANKKLHVDGGMTIGSAYDNTAVTANSLNVEGTITSGAISSGAITSSGTVTASERLIVTGNTNSYSTAPVVYFDSTSTTAGVRDWAMGPADDAYGNFHIFVGASTGADPVGTGGRVLTISNTGNATFAGTISSGAITSTGLSQFDTAQVNAGGLRVQGGGTYSDPGNQMYLHADGSGYGRIAVFDLRFMTGGNNVRTIQALKLTGTGAAVFANTISSGAITVNSGSTTSITGTGYLNINSNVGGVATNSSKGLHIGWNKSNGGREINMIFDGGTTQADTEMIFTSTDGTTYTDIFQINGAVGTGVDIKSGGLRIGTTTVIDASRNLTNIGTYTGLGTMTLGNYTGGEQLQFLANSNGTSHIYWRDNNQSEGTYLKAKGESGGGDITFGARWDDDEDKIFFKLRQSSAGYAPDAAIGIGISPTEILHLYEDNSTMGNTMLKVHNNKTDDAAVLWLEGKRTSSNDTAQLIGANNGNVVTNIRTISSGDNGALKFYTSISGTGSTVIERFGITDGGNITVGGTTVIDASRNITGASFTDGYITWSAAQLNRYGSNIELQYTPTNSSTTVKIGANGSNPTIFNAYTGAASFAGTISSGAITATNVQGGSGSVTTPIGTVRAHGTSSAYVSASKGSETAFMGVDTSGYAMFGALTNHDVVIRANNTEYLRILTGGNVQIRSGALQMNSTTVIDSSRNITAGSSISATGARSVVLNGQSGVITSQGDTGGWAFGYHAKGSSGTDRGGFGFLGGANTLAYFYIGSAYNRAPALRGYPSGAVNVGTNQVIGTDRTITTGTAQKGLIVDRDVGASITLGNDGTYGASGGGRYTTLGFSGITNGYNRIFAKNSGEDGIYICSATSRSIVFRTNGGAANTFIMTDGGDFKVGSTTVIDASRNITGQEVAASTRLFLNGGNYEGQIVFGTTDAWRVGIRQHDDGEAEMRIWAKNANGRVHIATGYDGQPTSITKPTDGFVVDHNNVGIGNFSATDPTEKLHVKGNILASGNVTAYSDERLKSDIQTLDGKKVLQMRGVSFTKDGVAGSGVIAQELEKVAPELIHDGEYKSVAYGNLVGYLIENAKQQQSEIDELKALVKKLMEK